MSNNKKQINIDSVSRKLTEVRAFIDSIDSSVNYSLLSDEEYELAGKNLAECEHKIRLLRDATEKLYANVHDELLRHCASGQLTLPGTEIEYTDSDGSVSTVRVVSTTKVKVNRLNLDAKTGIKQTLTGNESGVYSGCVRVVPSRLKKACDNGLFNRDEVFIKTTVDQIQLDLECPAKKGGN